MEKFYISIAKTLGNDLALTQEQGNIIYEMIASEIKKEKQVELDFENIDAVIPPFLNNSIGKLYGLYDCDTIGKYLIIKNLPSGREFTLNLVIENAKKFYYNKQDKTD